MNARHKWKSNTAKTASKCEKCGVKTRFSKRRSQKDKSKFISVVQWSRDGKVWTEGDPAGCTSNGVA